MTELLTQNKADDVISAAQDFMQSERNAPLDGGFASQRVAERIVDVGEQAATLLRARPVANCPGLYEPLGQGNADQYDTAAAILPGHMVLVPSTLVEYGASQFYPAVVSEDGIKTGLLRLHVLRRPYQQHLGYGAAMILSAAGQAETQGVGEHRSDLKGGVEAEHFATLLAAGSDADVRAGWRSGHHINHDWRQQPRNSVTTAMSQRLFEDIPQSTITITKAQIQSGQARLFWHERMRDERNMPETATRKNALIVVQGLGFTALRQRGSQAVDAVKELISEGA